MTPLEILEKTIHDLLIEKDGDVSSEDLVEIRNRAKDIKLDERQLNKLIQEIYAGINWESRRKQKEEAQKKEDDLKKALAEQRKNEGNATETLDFILDQCSKDKVFEINEIKVFFETARELNQDDNLAAKMLKDYFDRNNYISINTPKGKSLKESLGSTSWYKDKLPASPPPPHAPFPWKIVLIGIILLSLAGGTFLYYSWYLPGQIDKNAKHMFSMVTDLALRSSPQSGGNSNFVQKIDYGSEMLVYDTVNEWPPVKLVVDSKKGFVLSKYLLDKKDFCILNSIFGDADSKEIVVTSKCRKALLDYFNRHNIIGKIDPNLQREIFDGVVPNSEVWQIFSKGKNVKPNTVIFEKFTNPKSKFTDFGFIVKNINNNTSKFVFYSFLDDETPVFVSETDAPVNGLIKTVIKKYETGNWEPIYTF